MHASLIVISIWHLTVEQDKPKGQYQHAQEASQRSKEREGDSLVEEDSLSDFRCHF
jgi:hypothetical protein